MNTDTSKTLVPGMPFINRLLGGGLPNRKLVGLVGPAGGGKTLLGFQTAYALASHGHDVAYIYMDGGLEGLSRRFHKLQQGEFAHLHDPQERDRRQQLAANADSHLQIYPQPKIALGKIFPLILNIRPYPRVVFVDQLGSWILNNEKLLNDQTIAKYCRVLKDTAQVCPTTIVLLHQIRSAVKGMPHIYCPDAHDADGSRAFGDSLTDRCLFLGPAKVNQALRWMHCPQTGCKEIVCLNGEDQIFVPAGQPGEYYYPDQRSERFLPTAQAVADGDYEIAGVTARLRGYWSSGDSKVEASQSTQSTAQVAPEAPLDPSVEELLAAATLAPQLMTMEDGRMLAAWLERRSTRMYEIEYRYALWCRCNGRRDLLELVLPDPASALKALSSSYSDEELQVFSARILSRVSDPKALKEQTNPLWLRKLKKVKGFKLDYLLKRWANEMTTLMSGLYQAHRTAAVIRVNVTDWEADCLDVQDSVSLAARKRLLREFIKRDISPEDFLRWMKTRYKAVPWIASTEGWLDAYAEHYQEGAVRTVDTRIVLGALWYDEICPQQLAVYALTEAAYDPALIACVSASQWPSMAFAALGRPMVRVKVENALCELLEASPSAYTVSSHSEDIARNQSTSQVTQKLPVMLVT